MKREPQNMKNESRDMKEERKFENKFLNPADAGGHASHSARYIKKGAKACGFHCIKVKDLKVTIGGSVIIEDISLHIHCGNLTAIIGKNGAGKSTLVKALLNEVRHEGSVEFKDIKNNKFGDLKIGYVPQHLNIDKNTPASVYDLFAAYISRRPLFLGKSRKIYERIKSQLEKFGADSLMEKQLCDLSGGELQRVLLSLAIIDRPNLLILDEPEAGMDHNGMGLFYENINHLLKNYDIGVLMVSHDLSYVEKYADHVILLDKCILKEGRPKDVFDSEEFRSVFGEQFV